MMQREIRLDLQQRRTQENEEAKYINTTETDIYVKGNLVFNYHRAKQEAEKSKESISGRRCNGCTGF